MAQVDAVALGQAYNDVRNDHTSTEWAVFGYDSSNMIALIETGTGYENLLTHFKDDVRAYGFVRIETGDELSKRAKFAFITWIGSAVSPLKRAKVSTDKAEVKKVIQSFAAEILASDLSEITFEVVKATVVKAGGANYGTGSR